jgi:hypothetical protein
LFPGWDEKCCACIARRESKGNANAETKREDGSVDIGLWQINENEWGTWYEEGKGEDGVKRKERRKCN